MDRAYAEPLDVRAVAAVAHVSEAHFSRSFRAIFGETPHRYLQRRRVERSMFLLRETDRTVTDICFDVGFSSLGTFSRTFREIVGESPSGYRLGHGPMVARIHAIVTASAPDLWPKTWYGMPAYARDGKLICFYKAADKFNSRYATFGFEENAKLDEGSMWATSWALTKLTAADEARIAELVKKAVS